LRNSASDAPFSKPLRVGPVMPELATTRLT
jgi:hypothetical protein